jgi:hypothetical protein
VICCLYIIKLDCERSKNIVSMVCSEIGDTLMKKFEMPSRVEIFMLKFGSLRNCMTCLQMQRDSVWVVLG